MATTKTTKAKPAAKKSAPKAAVKKTAAAKKAPAKKPAAKSSTKPRNISPEERYKMVEVAAYYIAERNNFRGNTTDYWIAAEAEIALAIGK